MKANEIKVGNWLYNLRKFQVTGIDTSRVEYVYTAGGKPTFGSCLLVSDKLKPIPLTESWLLRAGFSQAFITDPQEPDAESKYWIGGFEIIHTGIGFGYWFGYENDPIEVKHVHQLQNLYFTLTGTELEFKPE